MLEALETCPHDLQEEALLGGEGDGMVLVGVGDVGQADGGIFTFWWRLGGSVLAE